MIYRHMDIFGFLGNAGHAARGTKPANWVSSPKTAGAAAVRSCHPGTLHLLGPGKASMGDVVLVLNAANGTWSPA